MHKLSNTRKVNLIMPLYTPPPTHSAAFSLLFSAKKTPPEGGVFLCFVKN